MRQVFWANCFLPGMAVSTQSLKIISQFAAKVHQIPSSAEYWGADRSHQPSYGVAIMLSYEISLSYDDPSKQR